MSADTVAERLRALQQRFADRLPDRLAELQRAAQAATGSTRSSAERAELHRLLHMLAGSSGSFGFVSLGACARRGEELLRHPGHDVGAVDASVQAIVAELGDLAAKGPDPVSKARSATPPAPEPTIFFLVEDDEVAQEQITQLAFFDYRGEAFPGPQALADALRSRRPAALVVDLHLSGGRSTGAEVVESLHGGHCADIPVAFVSSQPDWAARLRAVRAGGQSYLVKPVDTTRLVETLDLLTGRRQESAYRVLVVDDTEELAEHYVAVLDGAGMQAEHLTDPSRLLRCLDSFRPDLVVMDLYMPGCTGTEVVQVLRQHPVHGHTPVVYLSTESAIDTQLAALRVGGDDFLTKPIDDTHLVEAVRIRAARFRALNELVSRDSLTGLLNHIHFKLALEREVALAHRRKATVAVVMLDIDHFKSVNDTYGHPVGDRVISGLARLLAQRLRATDIAARYGGEEFAIILPDTSAEQARQVVDELRKQFAAVQHASTQGAFRATFSAGVASVPPNDDMQSVLDDADRALYLAKRAGRNQVALAPVPAD